MLSLKLQSTFMGIKLCICGPSPNVLGEKLYNTAGFVILPQYPNQQKFISPLLIPAEYASDGLLYPEIAKIFVQPFTADAIHILSMVNITPALVPGTPIVITF